MTIGSKYALLDNVCWIWSEFEGKIDGCRWWSEAALARRADVKQLRHEHSVPRRVIIRHLLQLSKPTSEIVEDILSNWCVGAVVTAEEDRRLAQAGLCMMMPADWDQRDPFARYRAVGIVLHECRPPVDASVVTPA